MLRIPSLLRCLSKVQPIPSAFPVLSSSFSTTSKPAENPSNVLLAPPQPRTGPKKTAWVWLKEYLKHTWKACKLSYADVKYFFAQWKDPNPSLSKAQSLRIIRGDIYKLVPFSVFVIVPFAELLIPPYLIFYQDAIPTRFFTGPQQHKYFYSKAVNMETSKNKLKPMIMETLKKLDKIPAEDEKAFGIIKEWIERGFNSQTGIDKLKEVAPVFEKHLWPKISEDGAILREFVFTMGLKPITGMYYLNCVLKKMRMPEVTLASGINRSLFAFYSRMRLNKAFGYLNYMDNYINEKNIEELDRDSTIVAALARGISPLMKSEANVKQELKDWTKMRAKNVPVNLMAFVKLFTKN